MASAKMSSLLLSPKHISRFSSSLSLVCPFSSSSAQPISPPDVPSLTSTSTEPSPSPSHAATSTSDDPPPTTRPLRRTPPPQRVEETICHMMASRPWTTRLQNSIRSLVPNFDSALVENVLHSTRSPTHALQFFRWVEKTGFRHDLSTHRRIVEILTRASMLNHARCILLDMPRRGLPLDEHLISLFISAYGSAGIVQESVKLFRRMPTLGVPRSSLSYDTLFKVILRRGRYLMAKRLFNSMLREGVSPTTHTYNLLLWGFFLSLRSSTALRFFSDMKSRGLLPTDVTYNTLINGCCRLKKMDDAEAFFAEMKAHPNLAPNVITYTTMIKGYVSVADPDNALRWFDHMAAAGIKPNVTTYSTLLPGLIDANNTDDARRIFREMLKGHQCPRDNSIFTRLMCCLCEAGDLDGAVEVLNGMIRLSVPTRPAHYGILIENFCKAGMYDRATKMLDKVLDKGILASPLSLMEVEMGAQQSLLEMEAAAYNPMIEHLCNDGQTKKAEVFLRQLMKKGVQDPVAFNNLVRGHSKELMPESALELLQIMKRRGITLEMDTYACLVESFLRKGEPADAKVALDGMVESGHLPSSSLFRRVMEALFDDGRVQTASRVMYCMIEKGVMENLDLVDKISEALLLRGHVEEALGRIDLLIINGYVPDFDRLLSVLCEKQKTIAALKLLDYGLERDCCISFSSYDRVLDALCSAGKTLNAYSILCKIMEKGGVADPKSIEDLVKTLNAEGNTKQADILSRMLKRKESVCGKKEKKIVVNVY